MSHSAASASAVESRSSRSASICLTKSRKLACAWGSTGRRNLLEARIDCVQFLDDGLEIGKVLNALALEFRFPLQGRDDLAYELRQPGHGMGLVNGEDVGLGCQEVAAITEHERLQVQFDGAAVHKDDRRNVGVGKRAGVQLEHPAKIGRAH